MAIASPNMCALVASLACSHNNERIRWASERAALVANTAALEAALKVRAGGG
jgi:hypothetical protein